jgi:hypothetical protein
LDNSSSRLACYFTLLDFGLLGKSAQDNEQTFRLLTSYFCLVPRKDFQRVGLE